MTAQPLAQPVLVDARNFDEIAPSIIAKIASSKLVGLDLETHDANRHDGLNAFMKVNAEGFKAGNRPLVFDVNRTTITGFSLYPDNGQFSHYINLAHADFENTIRWEKAKTLLDALPEDGLWVAHNLMYEQTMLKKSLGYDIGGRGICTMQMAVSAYSPDEYEVEHFRHLTLGPIKEAILPDAARAFRDFDPGKEMSGAQGELFAKFVGKESNAAHSYNGWVDTISRPYDLKRCIKYWFGVEMQTFEETLDGEVHMGKLTGEQVVGYGCDDAFWAVKLYHKLLAFMMATNPAVVQTFFRQELPMVGYFSETWQKGLRINADAVSERRLAERIMFAETLRTMKKAIKSLLPFDSQPHEGLMKYDAKWYEKGASKYRAAIAAWANSPDTDDFNEAYRVRGSVPNAWAEDEGKGENKTGLNLTHYMPARVMLYDLLREKCIVEKGKVQSDAECRGKMKDRLDKKLKEEGENDRLKAGLQLLECMTALASIEQRAKLYLNPYMQLVDPDTSRVYPVLSSKLASRRMAMSYPNGMQLAKKGDSTYVRGFYLPDYDDHVILSCDWFAIELVLIAEFSGDPEFRKAYGQLPYEDLHLGAAASCLSVVWGERLLGALDKHWSIGERYGVPPADMLNDVTAMEWLLRTLKKQPDVADIEALLPEVLVNLKGQKMEPAAALKFWRGTDCGKGANFGYWYSGALSDVGQRLGWSSDQMWKATERYRERFAVAEKWRTDTIRFAQENGYVQLPDGHRRTRFEATLRWQEMFLSKFSMYPDQGIQNFARAAARNIARRAGNQSVNSMIQGSCATMAKRSIQRLRTAIAANGYSDREMRVLIPIHDELLMSVHKDLVVPAIAMMRDAMCFADIVQTLPLTVAPAIGRTFEPYSPKGKNPRMYQIELEELSSVPCVAESRWGKAATDDEVRAVVDWIFEKETA